MFGLWWYIPSKIGMIRRLKVCSDKHVEFRFQEAVRVKVFKSILITAFLFVLTAMSIPVIETSLEIQATSTIANVLKDKDNYKNASDNEKTIILENELKKVGIDNNSSYSKAVEEVAKPFIIVILVLVYMGWLKKCRLSAIYHVAGIKIEN
ncbi:hypothetical protein LVO94_002208 [Enterococcus faecalis]|nr:hypothetical protein [Enterococcus faecalis]